MTKSGNDDKWSVVFLDAGTLERGDVSFERFTEQWECEFHRVTGSGDLEARLEGHNVAVTNKVGIDAAIMASPGASALRLVAVAATGTNNVDLEAASASDLAVCNVPGYSTDCVVQHTFGFMLELFAHVGGYGADVRAGEWEKSPSFTMLTRPMRELAGKTLGIIGRGAIGGAVAKVAEAFGMHVLTSKRPGTSGPAPSGRVELDELLERADVLSLHCPLTPQTENLIDARALALMKPTAFVINVARGGIVNEEALVDALRANRLAGAAADVLTEEPPRPGHVMIKAARELDNLLITPHVAWACAEARQRLLDEIAKNISAFQSGGERNRVR